jgi:SNF family Na+-dependent transporter
MDDPVAEVSVGTSGIRWFGLWRTLLRFVAPVLLAIALFEAIPSTWQAIVDLS